MTGWRDGGSGSGHSSSSGSDSDTEAFADEFGIFEELVVDVHNASDGDGEGDGDV